MEENTQCGFWPQHARMDIPVSAHYSVCMLIIMYIHQTYKERKKKERILHNSFAIVYVLLSFSAAQTS